MNSHLAIRNTRRVGDTLVVEVDTTEAHWQGKKWTTLSGYQKRKFETLIVLGQPQEEIKILYV